MKRILLAFLSVLAALTCPTALVAAQEAVSDDPAQAAYLDRASEASLSLDDVAPGWQADRHYTLFIEALGLVVSDAMFSFPDEQLDRPHARPDPATANPPDRSTVLLSRLRSYVQGSWWRRHRRSPW